MNTSLANYSKQQGVALIIVLMIVALVAIIATEMGSRLQLQVTRATNIKDNNQAFWYAMGAEQFAIKSIGELLESNPDVISLEAGWSEQFTFPLEGGGIQAQLTDMQTCLNINAIDSVNRVQQGSSQNGNDGDNTNGDSEVKKALRGNSSGDINSVPEEALAFERLLTNVVPELDNYSIEVVRDSLIDWLDQDDNMSQSGAEDADYAALVNPYLAANNLMVSKSEIRLVNGVKAQWINDLLPMVCVIPNVSEMKINVNTVKEDQAPVLAALTGAPVSEIQSLISNRAPDGYQNVQDFLAETLFTNHTLTEQQQRWFDVKTEYFLLHTKTRYNNATFAMSSLLKVENNDQMIVIRREFGGVL
ncbi:type II secretion system minor pseudopilin GspK [Aliiglaciecola sp. 2_MG-2023]|uniref:type II secretion system minor pseudopilin GspK n=1 Tax=unclassified Aliiglaciecola TaxID=2593648 RepID=UPI0026E30932|nr:MULTISPECIES: type II secretion system minor pseudopilin GspK [unclassified Aliiglaciecola]MDO6711105.1 type II secretion system minor pseudopilin GspK [Aliiglaciecola sp. 2_MG-2023]